MSTPFLGQISPFSFGYAPKGWALCNGQQLPINQNQALFSLLGTTYGGNGQTTFALPNLQGNVAIGMGDNAGVTYNEGAVGGEANHTLTVNEMPTHTHGVAASSTSVATSLVNPINSNYPAAPAVAPLYAGSANTTLGGGSSPSGGNGAHPNQQPYLVISYCIALQGIFPSRN